MREDWRGTVEGKRQTGRDMKEKEGKAMRKRGRGTERFVKGKTQER